MPDLLELDVTDVAGGGDGVARAPDGRVVFVRGGVAGDRVRAEVTQDRPRRLHAEVVEVLQPSADRVEPPCPHVGRGCGGCGWQHLAVDAQRRAKVRMVDDALARIGRFGVDEIAAAPVEVRTLPTAGFRTTVRCLVEDGRAAFRAARSHRPVPVDHCLVAHPAIQEILGEGRFGAATEISVRVSATTGERMVLHDGPDDVGVDVPDDVAVVRDRPGNARPDAVPTLTEVVADREYRISPTSFFQTRTDGAAALVAAVREAGAGSWGGGTFADLYGGVGLFAAALGTDQPVILVESNPVAIADAHVNLSESDARVVRSRVERWRPRPADIVVADPPRAGLGKDGVGVVAASGADRVVLVSCDAGSFARDAAGLASSGYARRSTTLVDLFPHTPHVELVSRFDRISGRGAGRP